MLVAYFDESGTSGKNSRVTTVAGFLGDSSAFVHLERSWKKRIAMDGISCFHATDCKAQKDEYSNLGKEACVKHYADLAAIIGGMSGRLMGVSFSVYQGDWDYGASASMRQQCKSTYHYCLMHVLLMINSISKERAGGEPVNLVFAKQKQYQDYALALHEVFGEISRYESLGALSFDSPECVLPLQAADLYAHETYLELVAQDYGDERFQVRQQLRAIIEGIEQKSVVATIEQIHANSDHVEALDAKFSLMAGAVPSLAGKKG